MTFIKNNLISLVLLVLVGVIFLQRCRDKPIVQQAARIDTVRTIEYIQQPAVQIPQYQPPVIITQPGQAIPIQYTQLSSDVRELSKQVQQLAAQFYAVNTYKDSIVLHDSSGYRIGAVTLSDVVSENTIKSRNPSYQLSLPVRTNTITIKEPYKPIRQVFAGIGINGSTTGFSSFDGALMYKDRHDRLFGLKAGVDLNGRITYGIGTYWTIRLHK